MCDIGQLTIENSVRLVDKGKIILEVVVSMNDIVHNAPEPWINIEALDDHQALLSPDWTKQMLG